MTIATPGDNGTFWRGREWSITLRSNMMAAELPFVAFRKTGSVDERFCFVLAPDPVSRRDVGVTWAEDPEGTLQIEILEDRMRYTVNIGKPAAVISVRQHH